MSSGSVHLRKLIAALLDQPDLRPELGSVHPDSVPPEFGLEKDALAAIYRLWHEGQVSGSDAVAQMVAETREIDAEAFLDTFTVDPTEASTPGLLAALWGNWLDKNALQMALERAIYAVQQSKGEDALSLSMRVQQMIARSVPELSEVVIAEFHELGGYFNVRQDNIYDRVMSGNVGLPTFPFKGLNDMLMSLEQGDPMMLMASEGLGKSTLLQVLAEHWQSQGFYVVSVERETQPHIYERRRIMRWMGIPSAFFRGQTEVNGKPIPPVSRKAPVWGELFSLYDQLVERRKKKGVLVHINGAGLTPEDTMGYLMTHSKIAKARGMELIYLDDYYQRTEWGHLANDEYKALNLVAEKIKNGVSALGCYALIAAQENQDRSSDGTVVERYPFGNRRALKVFQQVVSLQRSRAIRDSSILLPDGDFMRDGVGNPRYWSREGSWSHNATLEVLKVNEGRLGKTTVKFENGRYTVYDEDEMPRFYQRVIYG